MKIKQIAKLIDNGFLNSSICNFRNVLKTCSLFFSRSGNVDSSAFHINFVRRDNEFASLCQKYGTDKGSLVDGSKNHVLKRQLHNYSDFYDFLFSAQRKMMQSVFECGIGTNKSGAPSSMGELGIPGASLFVWRDYFPNAQIFGADIDSDCIFQDKRISTRQVDQLNADSINKMWKDFNIESVDLIIDDGLHTFEGGKILFENSIDKLKDGGFYIIEDVLISEVQKFRKFLDSSPYNAHFVHLIRKGVALGDNSLIVIRKESLR